MCDCGTGTIGGIESGKAKPSFDMMVRIAEALKVNPADFFIKDASRSKAIKNALNFFIAATEFSEKTSQSPKSPLSRKRLSYTLL